MAFDTLREYVGQTVVYIGEWMMGCADARFFALLRADFDAVDGAELPQWYMRDDRLLVFRRRGTRNHTSTRWEFTKPSPVPIPFRTGRPSGAASN